MTNTLQSLSFSDYKGTPGITETHELQPGMFISIPAWKTFGCISSTEAPTMGSDDAIIVLLQEDPESDTTIRYTLEPGQYTIEG